MRPRNWTIYISRQSSNNTVQLHVESVQKPHPTKKKQAKIALIYLFFECNFPSIFWTLNFYMKRNSHAAPLKIFKNWITQNSLRWQFMQSTHLALWLRVSLESRLGLGFRFSASGLLKSKFFLCANRLLHIVYLLLLLFLQLLLLLLFVMPIKLVKYLLMF